MFKKRLCYAPLAALSIGLLVSEAHALSGYWHGVRNGFFGQGVQGGSSNGYSAPPPGGNPIGVPTVEAVFADRARRFSITVNDERVVDDLIFTAVNNRYVLNIAANKALYLLGGGVETRTAKVPLFNIQGRLTFLRQSTGGEAAYSVGPDGDLSFSKTSGPLSGHEVTVGSIVTNGAVDLGDNQLTVSRFYRSNPQATLFLDTDGAHTGRIVAPQVTLDGELVVFGTLSLPVGLQKIVVQATQRTGTFDKVHFVHFSNKVRPRIVYNGGQVILVLAPP